jgi:hypothetical protein
MNIILDWARRDFTRGDERLWRRRRGKPDIPNVGVGLRLACSAIFATPSDNVNQAGLAGAAVPAIIFAGWARRSDRMKGQSGSNIALGAILPVTAGARLGRRGGARRAA